MSTYEKFRPAVRKACNVIAMVAMVSVFGIMCVLVVDIILRSTTESMAVRGTYELTEMTMIIIIFLGMAVTQMEKEHIHVEMLVEKFPFRLKSYISAIVSVFTTGLAFITFYACVQQALSNAASGISTAVLFIPLYPFAWIMATGMAVLTAILVLDTIDAFIQAITKKTPVKEIVQEEPIAQEENVNEKNCY